MSIEYTSKQIAVANKLIEFIELVKVTLVHAAKNVNDAYICEHIMKALETLNKLAINANKQFHDFWATVDRNDIKAVSTIVNDTNVHLLGGTSVPGARAMVDEIDKQAWSRGMREAELNGGDTYYIVSTIKTHITIQANKLKAAATVGDIYDDIIDIETASRRSILELDKAQKKPFAHVLEIWTAHCSMIRAGYDMLSGDSRKEPVFAPVFGPVPGPVPKPAPKPVPEPVPEPVPKPAPEPVREPVPEPVPGPVPEPVLDGPKPSCI